MTRPQHPRPGFTDHGPLAAVSARLLVAASLALASLSLCFMVTLAVLSMRGLGSLPV